MRTPKKQHELVEMSEHLHYELHTLRDTAKLLQDSHPFVTGPVPLPILEVIRNALLESFLVHLRSLLHFLYSQALGKNAQKDDFIAQDYLPGYSVSCPPELIDAYERVNKEIAHLTLERAKRKDKRWEFVKHAQEIETAFASFLVQVQDDRLEPEILAYKTACAAPTAAPVVAPPTGEATLSPVTSTRTTSDHSRIYGAPKCL